MSCKRVAKVPVGSMLALITSTANAVVDTKVKLAPVSAWPCTCKVGFAVSARNRAGVRAAIPGVGRTVKGAFETAV